MRQANLQKGSIHRRRKQTTVRAKQCQIVFGMFNGVQLARVSEYVRKIPDSILENH
jgi:hypothetical protein